MRSTHRAGHRSSCRHSAGRLSFRSIRATSSGRSVGSRGGFTLLEVMIATAVTLLMMISLVQVFKVIGDSMKQGRAALQMNNSLRSVTTRLRQDLGNLTVRVDPPSDTSSGGGYFEYYDGSMTDYTAAIFATDAPKSNRFGDTDDILMFTARAGSSWFTGQVPGYIVTGNSADTAAVVITSQLAEIAVFARPVLSAAGTSGFDDTDSNGFPDSFRLHYRVLLIRPDLNTVGSTAVRTLPFPSSRAFTGDTPTTMASYFADCDLSMRRVYNGGSTADQIAANSLEDLANPANRFAHFQYNLPNLSNTGTSCTMPLLVLDNEITLPALNSNGLYPDPNPNLMPGVTGNFLSSKYVLGYDDLGVGTSRVGEDVIANNILAFDVKGYDPGVPVIATQGADGAWGVGNAGTAGQDGSDDIILTPNDPGYALAFTGTNMTVGYGEYVDLLWGKKALNSLASYPFTSTPTPNFSTALSGLEGTLPTSKPILGGYYSNGLKRSGKLLFSLGNFELVQPTYDTWTTAFESNGTPQLQLGTMTGNTTNDLGTIDVNARSRKNGGGSLTISTIDTGTDGLDNNSSGGVDETAERETLPPFPIKLRGIKVSVRIEDLNTRQIKQMSVASEFATQ